MQISTFGWRGRNRETAPGQWNNQWNNRRESFFDARRLGEIMGGLVFSSALWGLLAVGIYTVYTMVLGLH
ncbi:hypothetical protein [Edaphobacter aggregans]|uniref:hypothetical protein n=1 Tax=Edaphobacter aggregans TaxID=570835 RepID=UPI0005542C7C|nr:hypothetical protein [Edaphobacter aggregans]